MRLQARFALSLLAACGIHAVLLLVPHAALVIDVHSPTVELELTDVPGRTGAAVHTESRQAAVPRRAAAAATAAAAAATAATAAATPPQAAPAATPQAAEPQSVEPAPAALAPAPDGQGEPAGASEPASPAAPTSASGVGAGDGSGLGSASASTGVASGSTPGEGGPVAVAAFVPPQPLLKVDVKYPLSARRAGFEGAVKVVVDVDESGRVTAVHVLASSGHSSLDQAVLDAYKAARYAPALEHGRPVAGTDVWTYRFKLTE